MAMVPAMCRFGDAKGAGPVLKGPLSGGAVARCSTPQQGAAGESSEQMALWAPFKLPRFGHGCQLPVRLARPQPKAGLPACGESGRCQAGAAPE